MRAVIQRVTQAMVRVDGEIVGRTVAGHAGLLALVGVGQEDAETDAEALAGKVARLRIFADEAGKMNRSVTDIGGSVLVVSQFTLMGDCRKGRRPSFVAAREPVRAAALVETFSEALRRIGPHVETGVFGADMQVELINDGPVTLLLDTEKTF